MPALNGSYVGGIDGISNSRDQGFVDFLVEVPTAGTHSLGFRYANGSAFSTVYNTPTGGWGRFASTSSTVNSRTGFNMVRLAKGSPGLPPATSGFAELDSITSTPR